MSNQYGGVAVAEAMFAEIRAKKDVASYVNRSCKFWKFIGDGEAQTTNSRGAYFIAELEANPSNRAYPEGGQYASFNFPVSKRMRVFYTRHSQGRGYTGDEWAQIRDAEASVVVTSLSKDVKRQMMELKREINRQCWGNGDGVVATATANTGAVVTFAGHPWTYFILPRGSYNWVSTAGVVRVNGGSTPFVSTCLSKNPATQQATFSALPSDFANTDRLVWEDSYMRALHGVPYHVNNDTGMYQGQSRAQHPNLRATIQDAAVASVPQPLTLALLDNVEFQAQFIHGVDDDAVSDTDDWQWWVSGTQYAAYIRLGDPLTRVIKDAGNQVLDLSYDTKGNGAKHRHRWQLDETHPDDRIDGLKTSTFKKFVAPNGEPGVIPNARGDFMRDVPGFDSSGQGGYMDLFGFYLGFKMDLGNLSPFSNGAIINLSMAGLATKKLA
jgi:hypothetical protein